MTAWLPGLGPSGAALAFLLLGHVLGDFAFQSDWMVHRKHQAGPLVAHAATVTLAHLATFALFLTPGTVGLILLVGLTHMAIDAVKARLREPDDASLGLFLGDQAAHLGVLLVAWTFVPAQALQASPTIAAIGPIAPTTLTLITTAAIYLAAFVFIHHGGNAIVRGVLPSPAPETDDEMAAGRRIGTLERALVLVLAVAGQWSAIALVIAAKSVARFEDLKDRAFAEYYLVGTLASVLVAVAVALGVEALV